MNHFYRPLALAALAASCLTSISQAQIDTLAEHQRSADSPSPAKLVEVVRTVTRPFIDVNAVKGAGYVPLFGCVTGQDHGAMGIHYLNLGLVGDGLIDAQHPEATKLSPL